MKSGAISGWADEDQFQIWSSHSLILEVQIITYIIYASIIYQSDYGNVNIFTVFHSIWSYMIFSVAYWYRKSISNFERVNLYVHIYIYIYVAIYRVLA